MEDSEESGRESPRFPNWRHIYIGETEGVVVVRFIDVERKLLKEETLSEIRQELRALVAQRQPRLLILDFEKKNILARGAFFAVLALLYRAITQAQGTLRLCNLPSLFVDQMRISRLIQFFPPYESLEDALAGIDLDPSQFHWEQPCATDPSPPAPSDSRLILQEARGVRRRPLVFWVWRDEILDLAHFTAIVNGAVILLAFFLSPASFDLIDPIHGPDLGTFALRLLVVSLPVWCLTFGFWGWRAVRSGR